MAKKQFNRKLFLILLFVTAVALVATLTIVLLFANPYVERQIAKHLQEAGNGKFTLQYGSLKADIFTGSIRLSDIHVAPIHPHFPFEGTIKNVRIGGFSFLKQVRGNEFDLATLKIDSPAITWFHHVNLDSAQALFSGAETPVISIGELKISDGQISVTDSTSHSSKTLFESSFESRAHKVSHRKSPENTTGNFDAEDFEATLSGLSFKTKDGSKNITIGAIGIGLREQRVDVNSIQVTTPFKKMDLANAYGHEMDWVQLELPSVTFYGLDFETLVSDSIFHCAILELEGLKAHLFRDKTPPYPPGETKMYHEALEGFPFSFAVDTIKLKNFAVTYEEYVPPAPGSGEVSFTDIYATIVNVSNIRDYQKKTGFISTATAIGKVMGAIPYEAEFVFPMRIESGPYKVSGSGEGGDMTIVNPMLTKVAFLKIETGKSLGMEFDFSYNGEESNGSMRFQYENLHVATLDKETGESGGIKQKVKNLGANLVISDDNLPGDDFKEGTIGFKRHKRKSIFNYWWKSLLTGIRSSMGLPGGGTMDPNYD